MRQSKLIGDKRVDREIDALWAAIEALKKAPQNQTEPVSTQIIRETGNVRVENESRDFFGFCRGFVFNDLNGIELEELGDEIHVSPLPTIVRKNSTGSEYIRRRLNLVEGSNITLTVGDDSANDEVDVTIAAASGAAAFKY